MANGKNLVAVIMAGGTGTRFWPLSSPQRPKQFIRLFGQRSLLQDTYDRIAGLMPPERILVLTNECFVPLVREQLPGVPEENIIGEPARRDTAGAVALAALICRQRFGDPVMAVLPADHKIEPVSGFQKALVSAATVAGKEGLLYTFGIHPAYAATSYGYLELGDRVLEDGRIVHYQVKRFKEKPDAATAAGYVRQGNYMWNSGMFVWSTARILTEYERHLPEHLRRLSPLLNSYGSGRWRIELQCAFPTLAPVSVDYGIMEKAQGVRAVIAPFTWSDVGGWPAIAPFLEQDSHGNAWQGRVKTLDAAGNLVFCEDQDDEVALIGVDNLVVARSGNRMLVMAADQAEKLKTLVESELSSGAPGTLARESCQGRVPCCKAYDIRGRLPDQLNEEIAGLIGKAFAAFLHPKRVVVGYDVRLSSPSLSRALVDGLNESGVDVLDIGLCGTEMVYFATSHLGADGGIMVTASHNPADYNGMKLVREESKPISGDSGLREIEAMLASKGFSPPPAAHKGSVRMVDVYRDYVAHLLQYVNPATLKPFKVVCNPGNGGAGLVIRELEKHLPFEFEKVCFDPDGSFPNGVPNPLLPENRMITANAVRKSGAAIGIAWDGDYDRCFLFDEEGAFVEGYYIVGLLAGKIVERYPGAKIVHDPRLTWNTIELVRERGGVPVQSKTGHAFIKERMRAEDAVYGGEMSAHHYFRDFAYCDSGMIPWLMVLEIMSQTGKPLSKLVSERMQRYPISGEINRKVADPREAIGRVRARYERNALAVDETDGVSMEFERWRFNLRMSNTEPVVRLNIESRGDRDLVEQKTGELLNELDKG